MYRQFNIHKFYVLPTQCIYVFCVDLRKNSDYFPIQHWLTGFYKREEVCLLRGTELLCEYNSGKSYTLKGQTAWSLQDYLTQTTKGQCDMNFDFPAGEILTSDPS